MISVFDTCYVEKSPSGLGLRGFFHVPGDYVFDKTVYYINNRSKGLEVYMPGATNRFVTVTGDVYRIVYTREGITYKSITQQFEKPN